MQEAEKSNRERKNSKNNLTAGAKKHIFYWITAKKRGFFKRNWLIEKFGGGELAQAGKKLRRFGLEEGGEIGIFNFLRP